MIVLKHAFVTLLLAALVGGLVAGWIILGGRFDVAVSAQLPQPIHDLIHLTRVNAVRREVRGLDARPADLDDESVLFGAVRGFESMCTDCHHPPGGAPPTLARSLNPAPANLREAAEKRSVAELFWVTKHGIRMSAMPAWGAAREDEELWAVATLIARFPQLTAEEYERLRAAAVAR